MKRSLDGVLLVDKPTKISSAGLVARVKKILKAKKVGHAGALDPFAEGLMILCLGKATRLAGFFLHGAKTYEALLRLGVETDTLDSTGKVTATSRINSISESNISDAFKKFRGEILQTPPVFSALKHKGTPLYKLAREGKPIRKPARKVCIFELDIASITLPHISFTVACSGGVYVRSLAADIGKELGCGAHLTQLKRIENGGFKIENALRIETIENMMKDEAPDEKALSDLLIPMAESLVYLPEYRAEKNLAKRIMNGIQIDEKDVRSMGPPAVPLKKNRERLQGKEEFFKIVNPEGRLIAVTRRDKIQNKYKYCCVFPT
jgi:tRNA pseudouridine55 synthase